MKLDKLKKVMKESQNMSECVKHAEMKWNETACSGMKLHYAVRRRRLRYEEIRRNGI